MNPACVPRELIEVVDRAAGKTHSADGSVVRCLAEVLARWDEMRLARVRELCESRRADTAPGSEDSRTNVDVVWPSEVLEALDGWQSEENLPHVCESPARDDDLW